MTVCVGKQRGHGMTQPERSAADLWDAGHSIEQIAEIMEIDRPRAADLVSVIHTGGHHLHRHETIPASQRLADALANYVGSAA